MSAAPAALSASNEGPESLPLHTPLKAIAGPDETPQLVCKAPMPVSGDGVFRLEEAVAEPGGRETQLAGKRLAVYTRCPPAIPFKSSIDSRNGDQLRCFMLLWNSTSV